MAIVSLLFGSGRGTTMNRTVNGKTAALTLDATLSENFSADAEPTENPIEDGTTVTDHVILKPKKLAVSGVVTETPMNLGSQAAGAVTTVASTVGKNIAGALGGAAAAFGAGKAAKSMSSLIGAKDRSLSDVVKEFVEMRDSRQLVTIQTGLTEYKDYVLTSFTASRDTKTGRSVNVTLNFQEVIMAKTQMIEIPSIKAAIGTQNLGRKVGTEATGEKQRKGSIAYKFLFGE